MFDWWPLNRFVDVDAWWRDRVGRELEALGRARSRGITERLALLSRALRDGDVESAARYQAELEQFLGIVQGTSSLPAQVWAVLGQAVPAPAEEVPIYSITSATLAQAYAYLTQHQPGGASQEPEWMLAVTGLRRDHVHTLEHLIEVKLSTQSAARAAFDMQDFTRIAVSLHEHGQALHAIFHSHRFSGPPQPSGTDDRLQQILEEGGYPAIQAVFSEDGYVRFFARRRRFAVEVHGKGVTQVDPTLYRIVHFGTLPDPGPSTGSRRGDGVRSLPARAGR